MTSRSSEGTPAEGSEPNRPEGSRFRAHGRNGWWALLLVPYVALLIPALYARERPELFGLPFFYWYQFAWVILSAACTAVVYWRTRS